MKEKLTIQLIMALILFLPFNRVIASEQKLIITGSSTVAPLMLEIAKAFEKKNPGVRIDVQSGGSSRGLSDARSGLADIGMASRGLKPEESDLKNYVVALDGICIILNKNNPVVKLTDQQIIQIFKGEIKNWKQVGGLDAAITVVNKAEGRSTLELFEQYFKLKNSEIKASVVIGDNEQGIKTVSGNTNAIGYVSIGAAEYNVELGTPIKLLSMSGVLATTENIKLGLYPLSRPLNLVTKASPEGLQKKFIEFATSSEVNTLVQQQYFVPAKK